MAKSDAYEKGVAMRTKLYGEAAAERSNKTAYDDPIMEKFLDVAIENVFGALWSRPSLASFRIRRSASAQSAALSNRLSPKFSSSSFLWAHLWKRIVVPGDVLLSSPHMTETMISFANFFIRARVRMDAHPTWIPP